MRVWYPTGTELHKTSPCFIQWEDGQGREREGGEEGGEEGSSTLCGLNFMSEEDAMKFLKGCTVKYSHLTPHMHNNIAIYT